LTSCLTGLDYSVLQIKTKIVSTHTADSKPVKQEVNGTVILPPLVFLGVIVTAKSGVYQTEAPKGTPHWSHSPSLAPQILDLGGSE
jgi:hypothetical protein